MSFEQFRRARLLHLERQQQAASMATNVLTAAQVAGAIAAFQADRSAFPWLPAEAEERQESSRREAVRERVYANRNGYARYNDVEELFGIKRKTVWAWVKQGKLQDGPKRSFVTNASIIAHLEGKSRKHRKPKRRK
jgi:hypothetical protein